MENKEKKKEKKRQKIGVNSHGELWHTVNMKSTCVHNQLCVFN